LNYDDAAPSTDLFDGISRFGAAGMVATLRNTAKDHKPAGAFSLRPIHALSKCTFAAVSRWLSLLLNRRMSTFKHLCNSSQEVIGKLAGVQIPMDSVFLHWDISDFHNTGDAAHLLHGCKRMVHSSQQSIVREVLAFLLDNQFVESGFLPNLLFRAIQGSGQGLGHSAAVANCAFLGSVEVNGPGILRGPFHREHGILHYIRYADNLLFILRGPSYVDPLLGVLNSISLSPYRGKIEELSACKCDYLDLRLSKQPSGAGTACILFEPIFRSKGPILAHGSTHPVRIHLDWPIAYIKTVWSHSSRLSDFHLAKDFFLRRLRESHVSDSFVQYVDRATRYITPHSDILHSVRPRLNKMWVPFDFHPLWEQGAFINNLLRAHMSDPFFYSMLVNVFGKQFADGFDMSVAWRVSIRPFGNTLIEW
jgi:hypothetical protein